MSIDLRLHILGLAAYVPEDATRMHLLLPFMSHTGEPPIPAAAGGGVHGHQDTAIVPLRDGASLLRVPVPATTDDPDKHHARLMYDLAYLQPNQQELQRRYELVTLEGRVLNLTGLPTSEGLEPRLTHELPHLGEVSDPVPRALVQELPRGRLAGRVTMSAGALTRYALGASFHLNDLSATTRMAFETEWTIRGITPEVDANGDQHLPPLLLQGPNEGDEFLVGPLYPIAQTVTLTVFNVISTAFPPEGALFRVPKPTESTHHFLAYHGLSRATRQPPRKPIAGDIVKVQVQGDIPAPIGPHLPGVICVQVQTTLEKVSPG